MPTILTSTAHRRLQMLGDQHLSKDTNVHIFDIPKYPVSPWVHRHCTAHTQFKTIVDTDNHEASLKARIISLHCPLTVLPLEVVEEDIVSLIQRYDINPLFVDIITAFGLPPDPEDGGSVPGVVASSQGSGNFECWYRLQYFERNNRSTIDPWSPRHTAVYQKHFGPNDFDLIILLHPSDDSALEMDLLRLSSLNHDNDTRQSFVLDPTFIHVMAANTYLTHWREHLRDHAKKFRMLNEDITDVEASAQSSIDDMKMIRELHHLHYVFSRSIIFCQGNSHILQRLQSLPRRSQHEHEEVWLTTMAERAQDHATGYQLLNDQVKNAIQHLQYAVAHQNQVLSLANQKVAADLNVIFLKLASSSAEDSSAIFGITFLGLIFLPGSFVATLFGMEFFNFGDSGGLVVGNNFWIFVIFWIGLTLLILSVYVFLLRRRGRRNPLRKLAIDADLELGENGVAR